MSETVVRGYYPVSNYIRLTINESFLRPVTSGKKPYFNRPDICNCCVRVNVRYPSVCAVNRSIAIRVIPLINKPIIINIEIEIQIVVSITRAINAPYGIAVCRCGQLAGTIIIGKGKSQCRYIFSE